jgi:hypothetical protein
MMNEITPSKRITDHIAEIADWRGKVLARVRQLIIEAAPNLVEEWKWDSPVWSHKGNVLSTGAFKDHVKINFFKGASLRDVHGLFNAGLDAKTTRAIDLFESDHLPEDDFKDLVRSAVAFNETGGRKK